MYLVNRWRRLSNILGIFFTLIALVSFIASIVFFALDNSYYQVFGFCLLFPSLTLNYLITLFLSLELINSKHREDLFINFYLFIFLMFPFVGIFFYFLLGFDSIHKDHGDRYTDIYLRYKRYEISSLELEIDKRDPKFKTFAYNFFKHKAPVYKNTGICLLDNSYATIKEITSLISNAKSFVHMEFYIFSEGLIFDHIFELFKKKIKEGVEIRLIVDYVGNYWRLSRKAIKKLKSIGVQVRVFNPLFKSNNLWWQFRNHNKILVVDNQYALFGSCNIADEYFNITDKYFQTTELSAKLYGSIVNSVSALFLAHWDLSNKKKNRNIPEFDGEKCKSYFSRLHLEQEENASYSQFLDNSPISNEFIIKDNLMQLIFNAQKSIVISTPYFFPPKEIVNALK